MWLDLFDTALCLWRWVFICSVGGGGGRGSGGGGYGGGRDSSMDRGRRSPPLGGMRGDVMEITTVFVRNVCIITSILSCSLN